MVIHDNLQGLLQSKSDALPKGFNQTRFLQNCMVVLQDTKGIEKCEPKSVARTMLKGAFLGLDFFNKECYAIPYGNSLQFQTDYKGEKKLAKKYSVNPLKDIYAMNVKEGDEYNLEVIDGKQSINFKPLPFNDGKIIGSFAVAIFKDDSMIIESMSAKEIEETRKNYSKMAQGQAWTKSTGEMYKKTVLRRLCKHIELDFDSIEQKQAFEDSSDFDFDKEPKPEQESPFNEEVIDADYSEVDGETESEQEEISPPWEEKEGKSNAKANK